MTYGEYLRRNLMSGTARQILATINGSPLDFGEKREFQGREITDNDVSNFPYDFAKFIAERL